MKVEIRLYKQHDADLIALAANGYQIASMMRDAICGYANGNPVHFYIDEPINADFNVLKTFRTRFNIPQNEEKALYLLQGIKHGFRNAFCKVILRDALIQQDMTAFFSNDAFQVLCQMNGYAAQFRNINSFSNVIACSQYKQAQIQVTLNQNIVPMPVIPSLPKAPKRYEAPSPSIPFDIHVQNMPVYNTQPQIIGNNVMQPVMTLNAAPIVASAPVYQPYPAMLPVEETKASEPFSSSTAPAYTEPQDVKESTLSSVQEEPVSVEAVQNLIDNSESAILNNINESSETLSALDKLMGNAFE